MRREATQRKRPLRDQGEAAVSDVIGSILLVGITVVMAAGLGAVVLAYDGPVDQVHVRLTVTVGPGPDGDWGSNDAELAIRHLGGEPLRDDDVTVRYLVPGGTLQEVQPTFAGGVLAIGDVWTHAISADAGDAVVVDVIVDTGAQTRMLSTGTASAGGGAAALTYVSAVTAAPGWGSVTAQENARLANDGADAVLEEGAVGGTPSTSTRAPGSATISGASNNNILSSNDQRAALDTAGEWVQGNGFTATPGAVAISDIAIGFEGRGTRTCTSVSHQTTSTGTGNGGTTVSTGTVSIASGHAYVATVASGNTGTAPDVTAVSGLSGITWTQLQQLSNADGSSRLEVWIGTGTAASAGSVTATFASAVDRSAITVSRYSGVDASDPVQASTTALGTGSAVSTPAIAGTAGSGAFLLSVNGVSASGGNPTSFSSPNNERADEDSGGRVQLALGGGTAAASNTGAASLTSAQPWQAVAFTLRPTCSAYSTVQLSYLVSNNPVGTPQTFQLTESDVATYTINIVADRTWQLADIPNLGVRVTLPSTITGSAAEVDQVYVLLTTVATETTYRGDFELQFDNVPADALTETLQLRYKTNGADSFTVSIWNGSWRACPGIVSSLSYTVFTCSLVLGTPTEHSATNPNVRVRIEDNNDLGTTMGRLTLDYARVTTA